MPKKSPMAADTTNLPFVRNAWYIAAWPEELEDGSVDAIIKPEIFDFDYRFSPPGDTTVVITYQLSIHRMESEAFTFRVSGQAETAHSGKWWDLNLIWSFAPKIISEAMREAATRLLFVFNDVSREGDWYADLKRQLEDIGATVVESTG